MNVIAKYKVEILGLALGATGGFLYYYFVGCKNGTCMIASNPMVTIPYGALLGYFIVGLFKKRNHENN
jgi:hypothetical protein